MNRIEGELAHWVDGSIVLDNAYPKGVKARCKSVDRLVVVVVVVDSQGPKVPAQLRPD